MVKTILFDLDNTLFDFDKAEHIALEQTLSERGLEPTESMLRRYSEINDSQWKLLEKGQLTRQQVKVRRFRLLFEEYGFRTSAEEAAAHYESLLGMGHYYMEGAESLLYALSPLFRLYLVTNGTAAVQHSRIESSGMAPYFSDIFISEEVGYNKPDKAFFNYCFAHIPGFLRQEAVVVGDSLTSDILGGINSGLRTVWFNPKYAQPSADIHPDYTVHALSELPGLLSRI